MGKQRKYTKTLQILDKMRDMLQSWPKKSFGAKENYLSLRWIIFPIP